MSAEFENIPFDISLTLAAVKKGIAEEIKELNELAESVDDLYVVEINNRPIMACVDDGVLGASQNAPRLAMASFMPYKAARAVTLAMRAAGHAAETQYAEAAIRSKLHQLMAVNDQVSDEFDDLVLKPTAISYFLTEERREFKKEMEARALAAMSINHVADKSTLQ